MILRRRHAVKALAWALWKFDGRDKELTQTACFGPLANFERAIAGPADFRAPAMIVRNGLGHVGIALRGRIVFLARTSGLRDDSVGHNVHTLRYSSRRQSKGPQPVRVIESSAGREKEQNTLVQCEDVERQATVDGKVHEYQRSRTAVCLCTQALPHTLVVRLPRKAVEWYRGKVQG